MENIYRRHLQSFIILLSLSFCLSSTADTSKKKKSACKSSFRANALTLSRLAAGTARDKTSRIVNKVSRRAKPYKLHNKRLIEIVFFPIEKISTVPPEELSMLSKKETQHLRFDHLRTLSPEQAAHLDEDKLSPLQKLAIIAPSVSVILDHLTEEEFQSIVPLHISFYYNNLTQEQKGWVTIEQFTELSRKQKKSITPYLNRTTIQNMSVLTLLQLFSLLKKKQKSWITLAQFRQIKEKFQGMKGTIRYADEFYGEELKDQYGEIPYSHTQFIPYLNKDVIQSLTSAEIEELRSDLTDQQESWVTLAQFRQIEDKYAHSSIASHLFPNLSKDEVQNLTGKELAKFKHELTDEQKTWVTLIQFRQIEDQYDRSYFTPHLSKDKVQSLTGKELAKFKHELTDEQKTWVTLIQFRQIEDQYDLSYFALHLSKDEVQNLTGKELAKFKYKLTSEQKTWVTLIQFRQIEDQYDDRSYFAPHLSKDEVQNLTGKEITDLGSHLTDQQKSWIKIE